MLTGATMYALAIGAVSHIIATVVARHSHSRRIERHAETFIRMHSLPQDLASEVWYGMVRLYAGWQRLLLRMVRRNAPGRFWGGGNMLLLLREKNKMGKLFSDFFF